MRALLYGLSDTRESDLAAGGGKTTSSPIATPTFAVSSSQGTRLTTTQYSDNLCTRRISGPSTTQPPASLLSCAPVATGGGSRYKSMLGSHDSSPALPTVPYYAEQSILTLDPLCQDASKVIRQTLTAMPAGGGCNSFNDDLLQIRLRRRI